MATQPGDNDSKDMVRALVGNGVEGAAAGDGSDLASFTARLSRSAHQAGIAAVASGRWLTDTVVELGDHVPLRDLPTLEAHYRLSGQALAEALVRNASRSSAGVGAAAGAVMTMQGWLPPSWIAVPFELMAETAALATIEMKLIGELHEVFRQPVPGTPVQRGYSLVGAWAERRGVTGMALIEGVPTVGDVIGRTTRNEIMRLVRRRALRRTGANLAELAPVLVGGAAGAAVNHRATRKLGEAVITGLQAGIGGR